MQSCTFLHIGLNCIDIALIENFYSRHFGFCRERVMEHEGGKIVIITAGSLSLELFQAKGSSPLPPPENDGYTHQGFRHLCFRVDDLDAKLSELGDEVRITLGPLDLDKMVPGMKIAWIADPEGNILELNQGYKS